MGRWGEVTKRHPGGERALTTLRHLFLHHQRKGDASSPLLLLTPPFIGENFIKKIGSNIYSLQINFVKNVHVN